MPSGATGQVHGGAADRQPGGQGLDQLRGLAGRGLNVTLIDVSDVGLATAQRRAHQSGVDLHIEQRDLIRQPPPAGPWDVMLLVHFLHRPLLAGAASCMREGGRLVVLQPTRSNLQRHAKPPADYLLDDRELPSLVPGLRIVFYREGWLEEGRHEALLIAEKATAGNRARSSA